MVVKHNKTSYLEHVVLAVSAQIVQGCGEFHIHPQGEAGPALAVVVLGAELQAETDNLRELSADQSSEMELPPGVAALILPELFESLNLYQSQAQSGHPTEPIIGRQVLKN